MKEPFLDEYDIKVINRANKNLGYKNIDYPKDKDELISYIEELTYKVEELQEEYDDLENDLESNYKPISVAEQVGWSHDW